MQVLPENADLAGGRFQNSNQYIQKRALAASAPAQNDEGLLWKDFETDSIEDRPPVGKNLCQVDNFENRRLRLGNRRFRRFLLQLRLPHRSCQTS